MVYKGTRVCLENTLAMIQELSKVSFVDVTISIFYLLFSRNDVFNIEIARIWMDIINFELIFVEDSMSSHGFSATLVVEKPVFLIFYPFSVPEISTELAVNSCSVSFKF
jgi:hypothetical protein